MVRKAPQPDLVDLHVHSTVSDGTLAPRDLVRLAAEVGLKAIALTDHDTVGGVPEALAAGREFGIEVIPGVEISAEFDAGACHILGYFIDPADGPLAELLVAARQGRDLRNAEILRKLSDLGLSLATADMARRAAHGVLTRAHLAAAMVEKRYVKSMDEAFDKYLGAGKPAYVCRLRVTPDEAIRTIRRAGGLASLAHPRQLARSAAETDRLFEQLAADGLEAIETESPDHTANYTRRYRAAAARLGLLETGGTDWHGQDHGGMHLGLGRGQMAIHYAAVERMKERLASRGRPT